MTALNRRALLKGFGAAAFTAGISTRSLSGARALTQDTNQSDADFDVAIVGAAFPAPTARGVSLRRTPRPAPSCAPPVWRERRK